MQAVVFGVACMILIPMLMIGHASNTLGLGIQNFGTGEADINKTKHVFLVSLVMNQPFPPTISPSGAINGFSCRVIADTTGTYNFTVVVTKQDNSQVTFGPSSVSLANTPSTKSIAASGLTFADIKTVDCQFTGPL